MVNYSEEDIKTFLDISSFEGLKVLYALSIAKKKKIAFDFEKMTNELKWYSEGAYHHGFLVACAAMRLVDYSSHKDIFNVVRINELLEKEIEAKIIQSAEKHDKERFEEPKWREEVKKVEKYFSQEY